MQKHMRQTSLDSLPVKTPQKAIYFIHDNTI